MGGKRSIILIMYCAFMLFKHVEASSQKNLSHSQDSLDSFLYNYALNSVPKPRTGQLYEVSPPANFSGVGVTILCLRTHSLWEDGANLSAIQIPPTAAMPLPFTRRVDLVYQNLGNWSTSYYNVPNYTLVAPVVGLLAYDSDAGLMGPRPVGLGMRGESPITVSFHNVSLHQYDVGTPRCVAFAANGTWQLSHVAGRGGAACMGWSGGHFSIIVPRIKDGGKRKAAVKWWMVGIPGGAVAVILIAAAGILCWKICRWRRVRKMEREAERSEGLNSIWIGGSRMPTATGIRTQPNLENSYIP